VSARTPLIICKRLRIALVATVLAGCSSATVMEGPVVSVAPVDQSTASSDIPLAADAEFRYHLSTITVQFQGDMFVFSQDAAAGDIESAKTDAYFFLNDVKSELAWLAAHPAKACYSGAFTQ
jgi:hypothetical protein